MGRSQETQPILGSSSAPSSSLYQHTRRPYRDTAWGVIYVLSLVLALIGGVYALVHRYDLQLKCLFDNHATRGVGGLWGP
jgi:hypothetical protein